MRIALFMLCLPCLTTPAMAAPFSFVVVGDSQTDGSHVSVNWDVLPQIIEVRGISMGVNVGADKLRFPAPVPVGSRVRGAGELLSAEETQDGGVQTKVRVTVEIEGSERPGCVIETLSRYYPER